MIPQNGQHVKCILRTGAMAEGIVQEWDNSIVQLLSLDGESVIIIPHPNEDIMLIKIVLDLIKNEEMEPKVARQIINEVKTDLEQKFQETLNRPDPFNTDHNRSLADLKIEMAKQDRKIIMEKLRDHHPGSNSRKVTYGYPGPNKK